MARLAR